MASSRPAYLVEKLLKNNISKEELQELVAGIGEIEMSEEYAEILEKYFNQLLLENETKKFLGKDNLD